MSESQLPTNDQPLSNLFEALSVDSPPVDAAALAAHMRGALDCLGELVGRISPDDVLGRVFATFCVGK